MFLKAFGFPLVVLASAAVLTACGGGGGGGDNKAAAQTLVQAPPAAGPEGFYKGKAGTADVTGVVLDDGRSYAIYTTPDRADLGGVVIARGSASNGTYTSTVAKDFVVEQGVRSGSLTASYVAKTSFNGTFVSGGKTTQFTGTYSTDYELTPSLAAVAGVYDFALMASEGSVGSGVVTVTSAGALSSSEPGCSTSGTVQPKSKGNVFDMTWTSTGVNCLFPGVTLSGIGIYDAGRKAFLTIVHNADITSGTLAAGIKR
ncbi:hypothetical protein QTI66_32850 [Variovorax sp. J22R133]|uniref:hypothetical protein n=1 Tax=Variovorax brevis TaxID=3053503 RepID=UPI0025758F8A|nr:hypothetical protein [Variovorax sp. J22R133]MDM0116918.1 hypothetical protein [Variovorax sp. J22R133]